MSTKPKKQRESAPSLEDDPEQSRRFEQAAAELAADADSEAFVRALEKVLPLPNTPTKKTSVSS